MAPPIDTWQRQIQFATVAALCVIYARAEEEEKEEKPDTAAVATAATLMGSIAFQMSLFYLMNHNDADMRRYTYMVIVNTVSIFCAVLLFQSFNDVVKVYSVGCDEYTLVGVHMCHMLVWFLILQVVLAIVSGAIDEKLPWKKQPFNLDTATCNLKTYGIVIAHMAGFASINAWGEMQQLPFFKMNPATALLVPLMSACLQAGLQVVSHKFRIWVAKGDDASWDEMETMWNTAAFLAENDVMALSVSFLTVQSLRFAVGGYLPNPEGEEKQEVGGKPVFNHHTSLQIMVMLIVGVALIIGAVIVKRKLILEEEEKEEKEKEKEEHEHGDHEHGHGYGHEEHELANTDQDGVKLDMPAPQHLTWETTMERMWDILLDIFGMGFAWATYYASNWWIAMYVENIMLVKLASALVGSFAGFFAIYCLDKLADASWTDDHVDANIIKMIEFIGLLIGFAWEQTFDVATEDIASTVPGEMDHFVKLGISLFCALIIVPAWRWWILPMLLFDGWKYGFVLESNPTAIKTWQRALTSYRFRKKIFPMVAEEHKRNPNPDDEDASQQQEHALFLESMKQSSVLGEPLLPAHAHAHAHTGGEQSRSIDVGAGESGQARVLELQGKNQVLQAQYDALWKQFNQHMMTMGSTMQQMEDKVRTIHRKTATG